MTDPVPLTGPCPNDPPCPHPASMHDIWTLDDPRPFCCAEGCRCGGQEADDDD